MSYDSRIILGAQQFDLGAAMNAGLEMAARQKQFDQQNALANLYKTQGVNILAGDQNALNALAGFDPAAAMGIQSQRQNMAYATEDQEFDRAAARREAERYAKEVGAEKAAADAAELRANTMQALAAPTPEAFDAMMIANGRPDMVGQWESREMLAIPYLELADAIDMIAPPAPDPSDRYKVVGGSLFDLQAEGGPAQVGQGAMQETVVMGPDGKPIMVQGGPGTSAKFTEAQSKDNVYATKAEAALARLEPVADALIERSGVVGEALSGVTLGLSREGLQSDEFQLARQAGDEFLQAILRKDTGAAITEQEQMLYGKTYLPQPGDSAKVLAQKKVARAGALEAIRAGMNQAQIEAVARADAATIARLAAQTNAATDFSKMGLAEIGQVDIGSLTPEQMDALEKRMTELGL